MFCLEFDTLVIGLSSYVDTSFECDIEEEAFTTYLELHKSYSWEQFYQWNDTQIGQDQSYSLCDDDLLALNNFSLDYSFIGIEFDIETVTENCSYLFEVSMILQSNGIYDVHSEFITIYVAPTQIKNKYSYIDLKETVASNDSLDFYANSHNLMNYFQFAITNLTQIINRYTIELQCFNNVDSDIDIAACEQAFTISMDESEGLYLLASINSTLTTLLSTYYFTVTINDTIYYSELGFEHGIVSLDFAFTVTDKSSVALTIDSGSEYTRFSSSSRLVLRADVTYSDATTGRSRRLAVSDRSNSGVTLKYYWKDLNNQLNFSRNFVTAYENYLVIDGTRLSSSEQELYLASNTDIQLEFTVEISTPHTVAANATATIFLEVNDRPSDGSCTLYVNDMEYEEFNTKTTIYALDTEVLVNCSDWIDQDSPPFYYSFYLSDGGALALIRQEMFQSHHSFYVGVGEYTVYCVISDSLGATTTVEQTFSAILTNNSDSDSDSINATAIINTVGTFLEENFYQSAETGDTAGLAAETFAAISVIEVIDTSNDTDGSNITETLTQIRGDMLETMIGTFEELPVYTR